MAVELRQYKASRSETIIPFKSFTLFEDRDGSPFLPKPPYELQLRRLNPTYHGRNTEDVRAANRVIWSDPQGNLYGARNFKGLPFAPAIVEFDPFTPTKLRVQGYKDDVGSNRIRETSEDLRGHKISTERIVKEGKLLEVVDENWELIPFEEWKKKQMQKAASIINPRNPTEVVSASNVRKYLSDLNLYFLEREVQVGERLRDLQYYILNAPLPRYLTPKTIAEYFQEGIFASEANMRYLAKAGAIIAGAELKQKRGAFPFTPQRMEQIIDENTEHIMDILRFAREHPDFEGKIASSLQLRHELDSIFKWINASESIKSRRDPQRPPFKPFYATDDDSIERYFSQYLPWEIGTNLGILHTLGKKHGFPTGHNWSAAGTFYDLDSVGVSKGSNVATATDKLNDLRQSTTAIIDLFGLTNGIRNGNKHYRGLICQLFGIKRWEEISKTAIDNMINAYLAQQASKPIPPEEREAIIQHGKDEKVTINQLIILQSFP